MFSPRANLNHSLILKIFCVAGLSCLTFQILVGQEPKKIPDRRKAFGESLKKYEKKPELKDVKAKTASTGDDDVIRIETNLVVTDALVVNPKGNAIAGLKKEDFFITENGVPQEMQLFSNGETANIPRSIVFIVEVGAIPSMAERSLEAAKILVDNLDEKDRMAIVNTNTQLVLDFTSDKKLLKSTLEKLKAESMGGRHNYSSLVASLFELFGAEDIRPIVINQTYGDELGVLKPMWEYGKPLCKRRVRGFCERTFSFSDVTETVERSRATIYTVVPGPQIVGLSKEQQIERARMYLTGYMTEIGKNIDRTEREKEEFRRKWTEIELFSHVETQNALIKITGLSGGITNFLEKPEDAEDIYGSIFRMIENRYTIGYYPKNDARDGKRRTVKIEVRGHPEYVVLGRKTYFAPNE
jgi:hypothetical protein